MEALYQDILVSVTGFFRDPEAFHALGTKVLPHIVAHKPAGQPIRVWVPGCATGEEVYSIAMLLLEALGEQSGQTRIQMFGTDISESAIQEARDATYPEADLAAVSRARLGNFFVKVERGYQVNKAVREICVFARHDLAKDPPFSNLDLISCRNVLIYMGAALQKRTVGIFHYALRQGGYLFLGKSESLSAHTNLFAREDRAQKIFFRKPGFVPSIARPDRAQRVGRGDCRKAFRRPLHLMSAKKRSAFCWNALPQPPSWSIRNCTSFTFRAIRVHTWRRRAESRAFICYACCGPSW